MRYTGGHRTSPFYSTYTEAMFTLYWIVKHSVTESVVDRDSVHTTVCLLDFGRVLFQ